MDYKRSGLSKHFLNFTRPFIETGVISVYGMAGVSLPGNPSPFNHRLKTRNESIIESDHTFVSFEQKSVSTGQKSFQEMKIISSSRLFTDPLISL